MVDSGANFRKQLNSGLLSLVLLAVLDAEQGDLYGYEILRRLQLPDESGSLFQDGSIYPVLRRLCAQKMLTSRVVPSYSGPPRRYYRITAEGRATLAAWSKIWRDTRGFVDERIAARLPRR